MGLQCCLFAVLSTAVGSMAVSAAIASFATPDLAAAELVAALERDDAARLHELLGPDAQSLLVSGDAVADRNARARFIARYRARHLWVAGGPDDLVLQVGEDAWPLPIPLVRREGRWQFDATAGAEELILRRIGANELRTIDVLHGFVAAQMEYAATGHDGLEAGLYAQRLRSQPGKEDGLYWEPAPGRPRSPAGPFLAAAAAEGYAGNGSARSPYHGYLFRLLRAQGPHAAGGARSYLENGRLSGGFALLAWPVAYGQSGVMTFIVNHKGIVWQRDLGSKTAQLVQQMSEFDPGPLWNPLAAEAVSKIRAD